VHEVAPVSGHTVPDITTVQHRLWRRAAKMWTDMHTLPVTNPSAGVQLRSRNSEDTTVRHCIRS